MKSKALEFYPSITLVSLLGINLQLQVRRALTAQVLLHSLPDQILTQNRSR